MLCKQVSNSRLTSLRGAWVGQCTYGVVLVVHKEVSHADGVIRVPHADVAVGERVVLRIYVRDPARVAIAATGRAVAVLAHHSEVAVLCAAPDWLPHQVRDLTMLMLEAAGAAASHLLAAAAGPLGCALRGGAIAAPLLMSTHGDMILELSANATAGSITVCSLNVRLRNFQRHQFTHLVPLCCDGGSGEHWCWLSRSETLIPLL